jgi:hypothetical protein
MAQDIRELIKQEEKLVNDKMPLNHEVRFLKKLDKALPVKKKSHFNWLQMAASIVVLFGLSFGAFKYFKTEQPIDTIVDTKTVPTKTLGDVSPGLKKVEDYYLASINLELSKMTYQSENKDLVDGYLEQLDELNNEYNRLSLELTENGPSELTVNALIDNLKYRLSLLYRLREQLKELNVSDEKDAQQSI